MQAANTPAPMTDIHGIKPLEIPASVEWLPVYIIGAILILAVVWAVFHFWKKFRNRKKNPVENMIPPHETALRLLETLTDVENLDGKTFYFTLSNILRAYIQSCYRINALEMTTEELLPKLDIPDIAKETLFQLRSLFRSTDPVKFADVPATVGKMRQDLEFVKNFILEGGRHSSPAS